MRLPIGIAPDATRNPPTPSTTRKASCSVIPASGTIAAEAFATSRPAR